MEVQDASLVKDKDAVLEEHKRDFVSEIEQRKKLIKETGVFPILTHFTPKENFLGMLMKANDPEFGEDAFRIRINDINEQLGVSVKQGWGSDRGRVSFYVSGLDKSYVSENGNIVLKDNEREVNRVARMNEQGEIVIYVLPWFIVLKEDFESVSKADAGQFQLDLDARGERSELIKRGVSLLHPLVQIYVPESMKGDIESSLSLVKDDSLIEKLKHQINYVKPEGYNQIAQTIQDNSYIPVMVDEISEKHGLDPEEIYEQMALFSMINPRDIKDSSGDLNEFDLAGLRKVNGRYGLGQAINHSFKTANDEILPSLFKQVARDFELQGVDNASVEQYYDNLVVRIKSYVS